MGKNLHIGQTRIVIWVTPEEKQYLLEVKGEKTWKDFILELAKSYAESKKEDRTTGCNSDGRNSKQ